MPIPEGTGRGEGRLSMNNMVFSIFDEDQTLTEAILLSIGYEQLNPNKYS